MGGISYKRVKLMMELRSGLPVLGSGSGIVVCGVCEYSCIKSFESCGALVRRCFRVECAHDL